MGNLHSPDFHPAARVRGFGATVFAEFSALALKHVAVNLGHEAEDESEAAPKLHSGHAYGRPD